MTIDPSSNDGASARKLRSPAREERSPIMKGPAARAWIVAIARRMFIASAIAVPSFTAMAIAATAVLAMALAAPPSSMGASLECVEQPDEDEDRTGEDEDEEGTGVDAIPSIDPGPAVRDYLARLHAEDWSRFDLLEARWTDGEPVVGAVIGPISGTGAPAANGSLILFAEVERGAGTPARLPIAVTVRPWVKAPIAVRDLAKGSHVASGDVRVEERPLLELRRGALSGAAMPGAAPRSRLRARKSVRAGEILTAASVEERPLVASGDRVTIVLGSGAARLTAMGIARRPGRLGDVIPVENVDSRRKVLASVVDEHTVEAH